METCLSPRTPKAGTGLRLHEILALDVGDCLKMAVNEDDYPWHYHPNSDELFIMLEGELTIDFQNDKSVTLGPNDILLVSSGILHRSRPNGRTVNLVIERSDTETIFAVAQD